MNRIIAAFAACTFSLAAQASCGAAFCMVNTGWSAQGAWTGAGTRFDLRYEYIHQDQPRAGKDKVAFGALPRHHDEAYTVNRNWIASVDHGFDQRWGLNASLPIVRRNHFHIHNHMGAPLPEEWKFTEPGDLRLLGRYQVRAAEGRDSALNAWGINLGAKLPTGSHDRRNDFGQLAERSLQPGSGTTDLLLGGYGVRQMPLRDLSLFSQLLYQRALDYRNGYRPGARLSVDLGARYEASERIGLMLQLNALHARRDAGAEAEPADSGGKFVHLSPGASWNLTKDFQLYGFLQLPLYQYVNGVQITANRAMVLGASSRF